MNAVGIDVSKGKSMIAVLRPPDEIVTAPYEVTHTAGDFAALARSLKALNGETRAVMEYTGKYFEPIANYLCGAGIFVSVVNPILVHNYGANSVRRSKTDKKDAAKLAKYALEYWNDLTPYVPEDQVRQILKTYNRQYNQYINQKVMLKNNLISLLDQTFPGINTRFTSPPRKRDGHEKWIDFAAEFWHCQCVSQLSQAAFQERYGQWSKRAGYLYRDKKAAEVYAWACSLVPTLPKSEATGFILHQAIVQLNAVSETLAAILNEMRRLCALLPEYGVVMGMFGVGDTLGPQLMAEIGDVRRFHSKKSLIGFAGLDAPPCQSGTYEARSRKISKRGASSLRKALFQVMRCVLQTAPADEPVYQYLNKKRAEGKHYYVYMMAGANKFLRIYYGRVKEHLDRLDHPD